MTLAARRMEQIAGAAACRDAVVAHRWVPARLCFAVAARQRKVAALFQ